MFFTLFIAVLQLVFIDVAKAKIYDRCDLAKDLQYKYGFSNEQISTWICIVQHESLFNTSAMNHGSGDHGLFQISQLYWCSSEHKGHACNANCASFRDDDISDDVKCVKKIYKEHSKISGNGFSAWTVYRYYCKGDTSRYIEGCQGHEVNASQVAAISENGELDNDGYHFPPLPKAVLKIYDRCSLATELKEIHKVRMDELATWICIAQHESSFNTSAVNEAGDYGLFQISASFWCSISQKGGGCNAKCSQFIDNDITDDFVCARTIFNEHRAISGNGFNAWTVYSQFCNGNNDKYIGGCPEIDNIIQTNKQSKQMTLLRPVEYNKVYQRCELAQELRLVHKIPENQISKWVCIAQHESNLNTSALGDGDHGIFQISEKYWCSRFGKGSGCYAKCEDFRDGDITDDIACAQIIYQEHVGISGDGFNAWAVYSPYCRGNTEQYISDCVYLEGNNRIDIDSSYNEKNSYSEEPSVTNLGYNTLQKSSDSKNYKTFFPTTSARNSFFPSSDILENSIEDSSTKRIDVQLSQNHLLSSIDPLSKSSTIPTVFLQTASFSDTKYDDFNVPIFLDNKKSLVPRSRQLSLETTGRSRPKGRPTFARKPIDTESNGPSEKQRPPRPVGPPPRPAGLPPKLPGSNGPPRPPVPPRPLGPSRPTGTPRPPPRPTTVRPFNWNNLPGAIFTLWPSSTNGPVSTSVYSTSPNPLPGPGLGSTTTIAPSANRYINSDQARESKTVKRKEKHFELSFPGYSFSRTKSGFRLIQSI
ncbi:uncharacterized protein LOC130442056 [Diorhabda sublineata]|uniref:uncharacterized protein LOC130442056 n=1 Tax=Diorhabda sublineata TaxID=1163346 RepID=UPI0024E06CD6|nr:uncharacterized protein LOC130442056 [Diorhabda sublineata]